MCRNQVAWVFAETEIMLSFVSNSSWIYCRSINIHLTILHLTSLRKLISCIYKLIGRRHSQFVIYSIEWYVWQMIHSILLRVTRMNM